MGDWLEGYVKENRSEFDGEFGGEDRLWKGIEKNMGGDKPNVVNILWKVAAVLFMVTTGWLLFDKSTEENNDGSLSAQTEEFLQAENFYSTMIMEKKMLIQEYDQTDLVEEFEKDLQDLDLLYEQLKDGFDDLKGDEQMINAMINNLRLRVEILNRQIEVLERISVYEEEIIVESI